MLVIRGLVGCKRLTRLRQIRNRQTCLPIPYLGIGKHGIGEYGIGEHGIGEHGIGKHGIGEYRIGKHGIGEHGIGEYGIGKMLRHPNTRRLIISIYNNYLFYFYLFINFVDEQVIIIQRYH